MSGARLPAGRGFTLLEVLVAVSVFSVMAVLAYEGLRNFLAARSAFELRAAAFNERIKGIAVLQQDLENLAPRPVRDALGDPEPAVKSLTGGELLLAFTRYSPWSAPERGVPDLRRIEYRFGEGRLWRRDWEALDRVASVEFREQPLLSGLRKVQLRYWGREGSWLEDWPEDDSSVAFATLPLAVSVLLEFEDERRIERIFRVGGPG